MGIGIFSRSRKKLRTMGTAQVRVPADTAERLNALFSIGRSIKTMLVGRRGLFSRHGTNRLISPRTLCLEADILFLASRKLAKEIRLENLGSAVVH